MSGLWDDIPQSSCYRIRDDLINKGYLEERKRKYQTTRKGELALESKINKMDNNILSEIIPALKAIPIKEHRAYIELILASIVARRDEIKMDLHLSYVIYGQTQKWKTWIAKFLCSILGIDPIKVIILVPSETSKSIITRKDSRGKTITRRDILEMPLVCFDELQDGDNNVKRTVKLFLQGTKQISYENETLNMEAVPIITLNPKEGENLEECIGLKEALIRRSVPFNVDNVMIPEKVLTKGEEILEKIDRNKPIKLPKHTDDCSGYRDEISTYLKENVIEESFQLVNTVSITLMCAGMTAFLPVEKAICQAIYDFMTIIETLGWVKSDWYQHLDNLYHDISHRSSDSSVTNDKTNIEREKNGSLRNEVMKELTIDNVELDYYEKLAILRSAIEKNKISPEDLHRYTKLLDEMADLGIDILDLEPIIMEIRKMNYESVSQMATICGGLGEAEAITQKKLEDNNEKIEKTQKIIDCNLQLISELGSTPDKIRELMDIQARMDEQGVEVNQLELFLMTLKELKDLGLDLPEAIILAEEIGGHGRGKEGVVNILNLHERYGNLDNAIVYQEHQLSQKRDQVEHLNTEIEQMAEKKHSIQQELDKLGEKKDLMKGDLVDIEDQIFDKKVMKMEVEEQLTSMLNLKDTTADMTSAIRSLENKKNIMNKEVASLNAELLQLQNDKESLSDLIEMVMGYRDLLWKGMIPSYDSFWSDLENLIAVVRGKKPHLSEYQNDMCERVRQKLISGFLKVGCIPQN